MLCLRLNQLLESKVKSTNTGGPAFPVLHWISGESTGAEEGMTLRDYFAAKALQGLLASETNASMEEFVTYSYDIAAAMVEARNVAQ